MLLARYIFFLLLLLSSYWVVATPYPSAQILTSDNHYWILEKKHYNIIFDRQYKPHISFIDQKVNTYLQFLKNLHQYNLSQKVNIVLLSAKNQTSNAFATLFPFYHIQIYPVGLLEDTATPFWLDTVLMHELNHIFQIQYSSMPHFLKRVFHSPAGLILGIFFNPYPNVTLMPPLFLEGDSVLKESFIHKGGRLYSGSARALVYAQIKKYQNNPSELSKNLFNEMVHPFSGTDKYIHGAYLFFFLSQKYSHKTLNQFFKKHAQNRFLFFNPLSDTTKATFNIPIEKIIDQYIKYYQDEVNLQRSSARYILFKSNVCEPFHRSNDTIAFLTSDLRSPPTLRRYNVKTKKWRKKINTHFALGKVFKISNQWYSRASLFINPNTKVYSLFSNSRIPIKKFNSKYVEDIHNNNVLYIQTKNHLTGFPLYLNNQFYSYIHSNALFDQNGNIYFFKQEGTKRTLYKNKQAVFSYSGYYGHLIHAQENGPIYFIASTPYGSSIFSYQDGQIYRNAFSDTITRAIPVNQEEFIACEITADGYEYKMIANEVTSESPAFYQYGFEQNTLYQTINPSFSNKKSTSTVYPNSLSEKKETALQQKPHQANHPINQKQTLNSVNSPTSSLQPLNHSSVLKYKKYNPLTQIGYSGTELLINYDIEKSSAQWGSRFIFTDYLQQNSITAQWVANLPIYSWIQPRSHSSLLTVADLYPSNYIDFLTVFYKNRMYQLTFDTGYYFHNIYDYDTNVYYLIYANNLFLNLQYPIFRKGYWSSYIELKNTLSMRSLRKQEKDQYRSFLKNRQLHKQQKQLLSKESMVHLLQWEARWAISYIRQYSLNKYADEFIQLNLAAKYHVVAEETSLYDLKWKIDLSSVFHLGYDFYLFSELSHEQALSIPVLTEIPLTHWAWNMRSSINWLNQLHAQTIGVNTNSISAISVSTNKVLHTPFYTTYPLSLRRTVVFSRVNWIALSNPSFIRKPSQARVRAPLETREDWVHFAEIKVGWAFEFLFFYRNPINVRFIFGRRISLTSFHLDSTNPYTAHIELQSQF